MVKSFLQGLIVSFLIVTLIGTSIIQQATINEQRKEIAMLKDELMDWYWYAMVHEHNSIQCKKNLDSLLTTTMKIPSNFNSAPTDKPFVKTDKLEISIRRNSDDTRIISFEVVRLGVKKSFPVKNMDVKAAWIQVEKFVDKI